ncbi:MAG TPA: alpha/beta fold hydrolase [Desulfobacteraceae bacterium]|nr:alpha/beta fold hydrolase [Deltaproteobacteria bacterium]RLB95859.1 MAG: alpha/beta hydrolase [Deltaproteobacteria bacterium]HDI60116.1 alpha/beta fold hydrolase [Desulfobacteraceae bacterium]
MNDWRPLYPFRSNFLDRDGLAYHYLDEGRGEPLLMVHGNPTWSFYFRRLVTAFSRRWRCVVPDHIGCGLSAKPSAGRYGFRLRHRVDDLAHLCDHLGLNRRVTLIVHDWGGMIGLAWALENPERIGRLVVLNTSGFLPPHGKPIPWRLRLVRNLPALAEPAVLGLNLFARGAAWMAPARRLAPAVRRGLLAPYDRPHHRLATLRFVQDIPLAPADPSYAQVKRVDDNLHRLQGLPVAIIWGARDFVFDLDYLAEWRRRFPRAETHVLPGAGHYLLEDAPQTVQRLIADFLDRHEPVTVDAPENRQ